ncbi:hypothetical protein [Ferrimonas balearica]|uniref:hypothetical protein n=1 Tax=Ferrimonas balearica TaxID=44012 RepID=UPI001C57D151|nr:hypothetical protein [Ferrimonas balearica]MBW3164986.1 hypothetical protein [Ferrimonas balearica]MBY6224513.1 hypothetical protein [Ferrimonas balearica]
MRTLPLILSLSLGFAAPLAAQSVDARYTVHGNQQSNPIVDEINLARANIQYELVLDIQRQVQDTLAQWGRDYELAQEAQEAEEEEVQSGEPALPAFAVRHCQP